MNPLDLNILSGIGVRFNGNSVTFITIDEYTKLNILQKELLTSNNELIRSMIDVLCYRLRLSFDRFLLNRVQYQIMNEKCEVETVEPMVLTLLLEEKVILIMEGGMSGNSLHDLILLYDKLLTMNIIEKGGKEPVDMTVTMSNGFNC